MNVSAQPVAGRQNTNSLRAIEVVGPNAAKNVPTFDLGGHRLGIRLAICGAPDWEEAAENDPNSALVRVKGVCLNYRDAAIAFSCLPDGAVVVGSEFVGIVEALGDKAQGPQIGTRVVGNFQWPIPAGRDGTPGILTNSASREQLVLDSRALIPVPSEMSDCEAAAFSLSAQTAFAMVRRAEVRAGERVLVAAGTSNTGLALIQALKIAQADVTAISSRESGAEALKSLGIAVIRHGPNEPNWTALAKAAEPSGGFQAVFDPFVDANLPGLIRATAFFGRYVTCGVADQDWPSPPQAHASKGSFAEAMSMLIAKNVRLIGNCLGMTEDLTSALNAYRAGTYRPMVSAIYGSDNVRCFAQASFGERGALGKPVFLYEYGEK